MLKIGAYFYVILIFYGHINCVSIKQINHSNIGAQLRAIKHLKMNRYEPR